MNRSLRSRMLAVTAALVVVGLGASGLATYFLLRSFLLHRVDQELYSPSLPFAAANLLNNQLQFGQAEESAPPIGLPIGTYVGLLDQSGKVIAHTVPGYPSAGSAPVLPAGLPGSSGSSLYREVFTAPDVTSGPSFRVLAIRVGIGPPGSETVGTLVIALPFGDIEATLDRLLVVEAIAAAFTLVGLYLAGLWLMKRGLRPIDAMATSADHIAEGDLSERVQPDNTTTEVGRLGHALNSMLARIEMAFDTQRRSEQRLRESEERLRRFVADASHELRTPITSIRGYAELFRRGAASRPEDLKRSMSKIEDEAARMGRLVEDLLSLARFDQGRELDQHPVDVSALACELVEQARSADPGRSIDFETSAEGATVLGDGLGIRQVLTNLLNNARIHTPAGTPILIRVSTSGETVRIEVEDHGEGIPPEDEQRVFERFYRRDLSRARASGGTGLGLAISAALVDAHSGRIFVTKTRGGGATFVVDLPAGARVNGRSEVPPAPEEKV